MNCGDAGHILLSKRAADDLAQYGHWHPFLHDIGDCEVKHGVKLSLVNLYTEELGNPKMPSLLKRLMEEQATQLTAQRAVFKRKFLIVPTVVVSLLAIGIGVAVVYRKSV